MVGAESYENFPAWIAVLSVVYALSVYALGAYILYGFGFLVAFLYLVYCLRIEAKIIKGSCVHCHYYGKLCGLGRGRLCPLFFKRGDRRTFAEREVSWMDVLPDFLVSVFPLAGGLILLSREFDWILLALLVVFAAISFAGNAVIRGSLACKHCRQRELGCPAEKLFNKKK